MITSSSKFLRAGSAFLTAWPVPSCFSCLIIIASLSKSNATFDTLSISLPATIIVLSNSSSFTVLITCWISGNPATLCNTFGMFEFILVPLPAHKITAARDINFVLSLKFSLSYLNRKLSKRQIE